MCGLYSLLKFLQSFAGTVAMELYRIVNCVVYGVYFSGLSLLLELTRYFESAIQLGFLYQSSDWLRKSSLK